MKTAIYSIMPNKYTDIETYIDSCALTANEKIYIDKFKDGADLLRSIKSGIYYDIIFIYCIEKYDNGNIVGNKIRNEIDDQNACIVYIADYSIDASKLIDSRPIKLLTEPISQNDITNIFKLYYKTKIDKTSCFKVKNFSNIKLIPYKDILYFESCGKKISAVTNNNNTLVTAQLKA